MLAGTFQLGYVCHLSRKDTWCIIHIFLSIYGVLLCTCLSFYRSVSLPFRISGLEDELRTAFSESFHNSIHL